MVVVIRPFIFGEHMTVPASDRLSQLYTGNGVNTRFDFTFRVFDQEDATGIAVKVDLGTEFETMDESLYQVTINQDNLGGYVVFNTAPSNQTSFYIAGETPVDQALDITNYDNFYPDSIEKSLDKLTAILQEWSHLLGFEEQARKLSNIKYDESAQLRENQIKAELQDSINFIEQNTSAKLQEAIANGTVSALAITTVESESDLANLLTWDGRTVSVTSIGNYKYDSSAGQWQRDFITDRQVVNIDNILELENLAVWPGRTVFIKTRANESNSVFSGSFEFNLNSQDQEDGGIVLNGKNGKWKRKFLSNIIRAQWFGNLTGIDDQKILNKAFEVGELFGMPVDIRGNVWSINGPIYCIRQITILADYKSYINVNSYGTFPEGWAVMFGDPSKPWTEGRSLITIEGKLRLECGRQNRVNGVVLKGAWHNINSLRVNNFNGTGVLLESLHDSVLQDISVEYCGNGEDYAFVCDSHDDTSNCINILRLQVEQSFQRGIKIVKTIRSVINNIHTERLYITDVSPKNTVTGRDINHLINIDNSQINQAVFQSQSGINSFNSEDDFFVRIDGTGSTFKSILVHGNLFTEYGGLLTYDSLICKTFTQYTLSGSTTFNGVNCETMKLLRACVVNNPDVKNFIYGYECNSITFIGGKVENVGNGDSSSTAKGAMSYTDVDINKVFRTGNGSLSDTNFNDCRINYFYGAYGETAKVSNSKILSAQLADRAYVNFDTVKFTEFGFNGTAAFLTRNCTVSGANGWTTPSVSYPAGTLTEVLGYRADVKIYQNTDGLVNWQKLI